VSAIHCQHADKNVAAILEHNEKQDEKARRLKRRRRLAAVDSTVLTSASVSDSRRN
jgi:hypothetical protein